MHKNDNLISLYRPSAHPHDIFSPRVVSCSLLELRCSCSTTISAAAACAPLAGLTSCVLGEAGQKGRPYRPANGRRHSSSYVTDATPFDKVKAVI